jgi:RNA polymerase sigma-70 factor (ECF subfamily)
MDPTNIDRDRWFDAEVQVHEAALRAWLRIRFSELTDVDDIVQEACMRVWEAHDVKSPKAFLFATARNVALDILRRRKIIDFSPLPETELPFVFEEGPSPDEATARNQELMILTEAIQSLPDRCRQVLTLRKIYGMSQKHIAAHLGIAEHTVESQVGAGMRRCSEYLAHHGLP